MSASPFDATLAEARTRLIAQALRRYPFRGINPDETIDAYVNAVIDHVDRHDLACGFEIRLGREQAAWTPDDVQRFQAWMLTTARPSPTAAPPGVPFDVGALQSGGRWPVTDAAMSTLLDELMTTLLELRSATPQGRIPAIIAVLLLDGEMVFMSVSLRDRIAVLKHLAQRGPVYGYAFAGDAFVHEIRERQQAARTACILGHLGTRTTRIVRRFPYRFVEGTGIVREPIPPDLDPRSTEAGAGSEDPYAEIFVSVPTPTGRPS